MFSNFQNIMEPKEVLQFSQILRNFFKPLCETRHLWSPNPKMKIFLFIFEPTDQHPHRAIFPKLAHFQINECCLFRVPQPNQILDKNIFDIFAYCWKWPIQWYIFYIYKNNICAIIMFPKNHIVLIKFTKFRKEHSFITFKIETMLGNSKKI